jgi:hypothetical protein
MNEYSFTHIHVSKPLSKIKIGQQKMTADHLGTIKVFKEARYHQPRSGRLPGKILPFIGISELIAIKQGG